MLLFLQPLLSAFLGLGLMLYGLFHSFTGFPEGDVITAFWRSLPQVMTVLLFLLGVVAAIGGLVLLFSGIRGMRRRLREIRFSYGQRRYGYDDPDSSGAYGDPNYR